MRDLQGFLPCSLIRCWEWLQDMRISRKEVGDVGREDEAWIIRDLWDQLAVVHIPVEYDWRHISVTHDALPDGLDAVLDVITGLLFAGICVRIVVGPERHPDLVL